MEAVLWTSLFIQAYKYLHKKKIMHRDIKPANILFHEIKKGIYEFRFADFGLSKSVLTDSSRTLGKGTPLYMAPEQKLKGDKAYSNKVDVYPIGLIMFEMLIGKNPEKADCFEFPEGIINQKIKNQLEENGISKILIEFILKCIEKNPSQRYSW